MDMPLFGRRALLGAGTAAAAASALPAIAGDGLSFDSPRENVRTMARMTSTLAPGKTGFVRYRGKAFALLADGRNVPMYDIDGIGALRAEQQDDGQIRFLFNEFALYLDLASGLPLERWLNPLSGRIVDVWHLRNGPVNYALSPDKPMFGNFARLDGGAATGFQLPWRVNGPFAMFALDIVADRKNPLDPAEWPLESSGATLPTTEHSQYTVLQRDLTNRALMSLPFVASLQSLKPWQPWMMMGQQPGRIFTRTVAEKVAGPEVLPAASLAFARRELNEWMQAPDRWTGAYVTQQAIYKATHTPRSWGAGA